MAIIITNIKELIQVEKKPGKWICGKDMAVLNTIKDAYLMIEGEKITGFGEMRSLSSGSVENKYKIIDATGKFVFPSFVDSHTHLVYPASREIEYIDSNTSSTETYSFKPNCTGSNGDINTTMTVVVEDLPIFDNISDLKKIRFRIEDLAKLSDTFDYLKLLIRVQQKILLAL